MRQSEYQNQTQDTDGVIREFKMTCYVKESNGKSNMQEEMGDVSRDKNSRKWSKGTAGNKTTLSGRMPVMGLSVNWTQLRKESERLKTGSTETFLLKKE